MTRGSVGMVPFVLLMLLGTAMVALAAHIMLAGIEGRSSLIWGLVQGLVLLLVASVPFGVAYIILTLP